MLGNKEFCVCGALAGTVYLQHSGGKGTADTTAMMTAESADVAEESAELEVAEDAMEDAADTGATDGLEAEKTADVDTSKGKTYCGQTIYLAEHTEEGDACPGHMTCRAGQSSFVINWQGMIRSCVVLDQPSYDAFDTTDDFMTLWNKIVKETEEIKTSMECNQCKLRHVCNTCAAAAIAECGDSEGVSKYLCEYTKETVNNLKEFY